MSYILEALKKAEHEREIGQVPRIGSEHEPATAGLSSRWVMVIVLVLLINAGLLLVLFWPDGSTGKMEPIAASGVQQSRRDVVTRHARLEAPPVPPVIQPPAAVAPVEIEAAVSPPARVPVAPPPVVAPAPPVQPAPAPAPEAVAVPPQQTESLPVWPQIPESIFRKLNGGLRLDVHVYSDQPEDRFVLINLQKYREGEQLQEGPLLDAITSDGVILSLQGQRFLVRAQ